MRFQKGPNYNAALLESIIRKHAPRAVSVEDNFQEVVYHVSGTVDVSSTTREILVELEQQKESVGVAGIGTMVTTLEDVVIGLVKGLEMFQHFRSNSSTSQGVLFYTGSLLLHQDILRSSH